MTVHFFTISLFGLGVILGLGFLAGCGDSKEVLEVREQLKIAQDKLDSMSSSLSSDREDALKLVEECRKDLENARGLIIEGNLKQATELIQTVLLKIKPHFEGKEIRTTQEQDLAFVDVFGDVKVKARGHDSFEKAGPKEAITSGMDLKTGIRSNLLLTTFEGTLVHLHAQSVIELTQIDESTGTVKAVLRSGFLTYEQKSDFGTFQLNMQGLEFKVEGLALIEFGSDPISLNHYAAVHRGGLHWKRKGGDSDFLAGNTALVWKGEVQSTRSLPLAPLTDAPENHAVFAVDPATGKALIRFRWHSMDTSANYQLQVSQSPIFSTRVFDDRNLDGNGVDLDFGLGTYYWRVRGIVDRMVPGAFSPVTDFTIGKGEGIAGSPDGKLQTTAALKGPKIVAPKIELIGKVAIVSGKSHPDAIVTVNGVRAVMLEDGQFSVIVNFMREGEQWIEIVARGKQGGETVSRHRVKVTF